MNLLKASFDVKIFVQIADRNHFLFSFCTCILVNKILSILLAQIVQTLIRMLMQEPLLETITKELRVMTWLNQFRLLNLKGQYKCPVKCRRWQHDYKLFNKNLAWNSILCHSFSIIFNLKPANRIVVSLISRLIQLSKCFNVSLKVGENVVLVSNSLDLDETSSYLASHLSVDPSRLHMTLWL